MAIAALVIVTHKYDFSNQIIGYFQALNPLNGFNLTVLPVGLDEQSEPELALKVERELIRDTKIKHVFIFADLGQPSKFAQRITIANPAIRITYARGNLIENAYLAYIMLNTKAPLEAVMMIIAKNIRQL